MTSTSVSPLKFLVVAMGVLIVVGVGVVAVTIYSRIGAGKPIVPTPAAPEFRTSPLQSFGDHRLLLPRQSRVVEMTSEGGRLFLRVDPPGPEEVIFVIDLATGRTLGTLTVTPAP